MARLKGDLSMAISAALAEILSALSSPAERIDFSRSGGPMIWLRTMTETRMASSRGPQPAYWCAISSARPRLRPACHADSGGGGCAGWGGGARAGEGGLGNVCKPRARAVSWRVVGGIGHRVAEPAADPHRDEARLGAERGTGVRGDGRVTVRWRVAAPGTVRWPWATCAAARPRASPRRW